MRDRNFVCGPVLDISRSPEYDIASPPVFEWIIHMLETQRLRSLRIEVPCETIPSQPGRPSGATLVPRV